MGEESVAGQRKMSVWPAALLLILFGLVLIPVHMRQPVLNDRFGLGSLSWCNFIMTAVTLILLARGISKKKYSKADIIFMYIGLALFIPFTISDSNILFVRYCSAVCNTLLPLFLIFQDIDAGRRKKLLGITVRVIGVFPAVLLCMGVIEMATNGILMRHAVSFFESHGISCSEYKLYQGYLGSGIRRFYSFWGNAQTTALIFNGAFVLIDIYHRSTHTDYPKILLSVLTAAGLLLCLDEPAMIIFALYLAVSCRAAREDSSTAMGNTLNTAVCGCVSALAAAAALFRIFTGSSYAVPAFSGMVSAFKSYHANALDHLQFLYGYGTSTAFTDDIVDYKAGFSMPVMMFSLDYGVLFSLLFIFLIFAYFTWKVLLRKKRIACWLGITLVFIQANLFNAFSLVNQDVCWMMTAFVMLAVNCVCARYDGAADRQQ